MTTLKLTPALVAYLRALHAEASRVAGQFDAAFTAAVRSHGITEARLVEITDAGITVEVRE